MVRRVWPVGSGSLDDDNVVKLESLDLTRRNHIDPWLEGKALILDQSSLRDLRGHQPVVVELRSRGVWREQGDVRQ